jgi:3-isopropylmalate/(R)-2-methylmalate dehydratase small subunit
MSASESNNSAFESRTFNLPVDNIDTDQIIPAQFLTTTTREGLGQYCFYAWRFNEDGTAKASSPLRKHDAATQQVLVAGSNFGCGSSREHAVWALIDHGFRVVIAPSFADIFFNNAQKNGLLTIVLEEDTIDQLFTEVLENPGYRILVDLPAQHITLPNQHTLSFDIDPFHKDRHIRGLDDIGLTLEHADEIRDFEEKRRQTAPWLFNNIH